MDKETRLTILKDEMKYVAAKIGKIELQRAMGQYVSIKELEGLKRVFGKLQSLHKKLYFSK